MSFQPRPCHREGCTNEKRRGRSYRYCSDECAREVALRTKSAASRAWADGHRTALRAQQLWTRYRLTVERFEELLAAQGDACAICRASSPAGTGTWHVDHDHTCCPGRRSCGSCIRGLLCQRCNRQVLAVIEGPHYAAALAYLERARV